MVDKIDMNEIKESDDKKQEGLSRPRKLELKKTVESGQVRQSFAHGRSKMVTVEVRKKRTYAPDDRGKMAEIRHEAEQGGDIFVESAALSAQADGLPREGAAIGLTNQEKAARARALQDAKKVEEERQHLPPESETIAEPEFPSAEESEPVEGGAPAQEAEQVTGEGAPESAETGRSDAQPAEGPESEKPAGKTADAVAGKPKAVESEDEETKKGGRTKRPLRTEVRRPAGPGRRSEPPRRGSKLSLVDALNESGERVRSLASVKRAREKEKLKQQQMRAETVKVLRDVVIPETLTVQELANRMAERSTDVIKALMKMGVMANINNVIDGDTAEVVVNEFGHKSRRVSDADVEIGLKGEDDDQQNLQVRPPVVTVMGHVDHGKTSLLDALRKTDVAAREAGGITQHIGAYQVTMPHGGKITFVDTPGHAAFTQMRARGAHVTDIVVLVVAADDGVMPQTIEAIDHAKAADVPLIIAVNKIDRPDSNSERVRTELLQHGIVVESMGGETLCVEVSAKEGTNLDKLEEAILLQAELLDLTANPDRPCEGVIVEAKMERGRGTVATVLVQKGTLRVGEIFVAGGEWGRVRGLSDALGNPLDEAGPGMPVEVLGLTGTPAAGDDVVVVESEARAREVTEFRQRRVRDAKVASNRGSLEQMFDRIQAGGAKELPVLIKADVHGSVEAIAGALDKLGTDEVKVQILHAAVGGINESDISLARASEALIVGFNVRANPQAREMAKRDGIEIRYYSIIYNLTDDLKQMLSGMLAPKRRENILGYAEIREVFNVTKVGKVAGCMTTEGVIRRGARVRLLRDNVVIHEGDLSQLKRFKDDVKEVREGYDCGVALANYQDIQIGDTIECFEVEMVAREL